MTSLNQTEPSAIALTAADTGAYGIEVVMVAGECFGTEITWFDEDLVTAIVTIDCETGLPMLLYRYIGRSMSFEMRGLEADGMTWWRYAHEADPQEYREHCLRIVRKV